MKKVLIFVTIMMMSSYLVACSSDKATITSQTDENKVTDNVNNDSLNSNVSGSKNENSTLTIMPTSGAVLKIPDRWVTENGEYFTSKSEQASNLIVYITDQNTGKDIVLCNRPNCKHDNIDCGAFVPPDPQDEFGQWMKPWTSSCVFADTDYLYVLNGGNTIYRMELDGTGRIVQTKISDKFTPGNTNWLYGEKLYMLGSILLMHDDLSGQSVQVLLEVDYINNSTHEIWIEEPLGTNREPTGQNEVIGIWEGKVFIRQTLYAPLIRTQSGMEAYYDNQDVTIYSINLNTGQEEKIISGKSNELFTHNSFVLDENGEILFHSRRNSSLVRLNLLTREKTTLSNQLPGFIYVGEAFDGKRLLIRENGRDDIIRWEGEDWINKPGDDLLFYDYITGEIGEITLKTETNIGPNKPMCILYEEDGYFYVDLKYELIKSEYDNYEIMRKQLGKIKKSDFWENNKKELKYLEWEDMPKSGLIPLE